MFSSNKWIAFWFGSLVMNIVVSHGVIDLVGRATSLFAAAVSAWFFMDGFMTAMRPSQPRAFNEANQPVNAVTDGSEGPPAANDEE